MKDKVIITGAGGQLGRELSRSVRGRWECITLDRQQLDIGDAAAVEESLRTHAPTLVINAAAYTAVDLAESEAEVAWRINSDGPRHLAQACGAINARLLHVSTDFVFDGTASQPYRPDATPAPLCEYGRSKLAGEQVVRETLADAVILRTGWVYSAFGTNFVKTMLRLMGEREELSVVADQVGTPTWAAGLASALWAVAERPALAGTYHWSDSGVCSWYDFAVAISEEGLAMGLLSDPVRVRPISTSAYPTPAQRPGFSVLDKSSSWRDFELSGEHWRVQLRSMLRELKEMPDA